MTRRPRPRPAMRKHQTRASWPVRLYNDSLFPGWRLGVVAGLGCLAYANSLFGPFIFDDHVAIVENESIRAWWRFSRVFAPERELPTAGRPLVNLSFALNYAVGGLHVIGYHLVNVAVHLLCGLLLFGIIRRTLELPAL